MLCLSGSAVSIMTSMCDWESLSLTVPVWTRGGEMDGRMVPATEAAKSRAGGILLFSCGSSVKLIWQMKFSVITLFGN